MLLPFDLFCSAATKGVSHSSLDFHKIHASRAVNSHKTQIALNAATGTAVVADTVFSIADDGINLSLGMVWNSSGPDWHFGAAAKISPRGWGSSTIKLTEADGREVAYLYDKKAGGYFCGEPDGQGKTLLKENKDGSLERLFPATGISEIFNAQGQLIEKRLPTNNNLTYTYNTNGQIESILLPSKRQLKLEAVNDNPKLLALNLIDQDKKVFQLAKYELNGGNLKTSIDDKFTSYDQANGKLNIKAGDEISSLHFDAKGCVSQVQEGPRVWNAVLDKTNKKYSIVDGEKNSYEIQFDNLKHLSAFKLPTDLNPTLFNFNPLGQLEKIVDPDKQEHKISYEAKTGLVTELVEIGSTSYIYNTDIQSPFYGLKLAEIKQEGSTKLTRMFVYNDLRQLVYEISPAGRVCKNNYESGRIATQQHVVSKRYEGVIEPFPDVEKMNKWFANDLTPEDHKQIQQTKFAYDANGRELSVIKYADNELLDNNVGNPLVKKIVDEVGNIKECFIADIYDALNPSCQKTTSQFDKLNRPTEIIQGAQADQSKQLRSVYQYQGLTTKVLQPSGRIDATTVDAGGLLQEKSSSDGQHIRSEIYQRNLNGSLKSVLRADGLTEYVFCDKSGRQQYTVDPSGKLTEIVYDERGCKVARKFYNVSINPHELNLDISQKIINAEALAKCEFYDVLGQIRYEMIIKKTQTVGEGVATRKGFVTEHTYLLGNKIESSEFFHPLIGTQLDNLSCKNLISRNLDKSLHDRKTRYFYDNDGLEIGEQILVASDKDQSQGFTKEFIRDGVGNITHEMVYLNKSNFATSLNAARPLNKAALVTRHWYDNVGRVIATLDPDKYLTCYSYFANGKIKKERAFTNPQVNIDLQANFIVLPDEKEAYREISHAYDEIGRISQISNTHSQLQIDIEYDTSHNEVARTLTDLKTHSVRRLRKVFNVFGELIQSADARAVAANAWAFSIFHPVTGLEIKKTNALGNSTLLFYDLNRRPRYEISPEGAVRRYSYDLSCGKPTEIYQYYLRIDTLNLKDLRENEDRNGFADEDYFASLLKQHEKDQKNTKVYDSQGITILETDTHNATHHYYHNSFNELETEIHEIDAGKKLVVKHQYDLRGNNVETVKDPGQLKIRTAQSYDDPLNRLTDKELELGDKAHTAYEGLRKETITADPDRTKTTTKDAFMRISSETNWMGADATMHLYADSDRLHTIVNPLTPNRNMTEELNAYDEVCKRTQNNIAIEFERDLSGNIIKTSYADGSTEVDEFDLEANLKMHQDLNGFIQAREYNADNQLLKVIDDASGQRRQTHFVPDVFDLNSQVIAANGLVTTNETIHNGLNKITLTDPDGLKLREENTFNKAGGLKQILQGDLNSPDQYHEAITRDILNRETARHILMGKGNAKLVLKDLVLDAAGNVIIERDGNLNAKRRIYDTRGNLCIAIDAEGFIIEKTYDANNREVKQRCYSKALTVQELSSLDIQKDPLKLQQLLLAKADEHDAIRKFIYDVDGLPCYEINTLEKSNGTILASVLEKKFDGNKHCIQKIEHAVPIPYSDEVNLTISLISKLLPPNHKNRITDYSRNTKGKRAIKRDTDGYIVEKRYDANGNTIARIHYSQKYQQLDFNQPYETLRAQLKQHKQNRENFYVYNALGNLRFEIDGKGLVIEHCYNEVNKRTDTIQYVNSLEKNLPKGELLSLLNLLRTDGICRNNPAILDAMSAAISKIKCDATDVHVTDQYDIAARLTGKLDGERKKEKFELNSLGLAEKRIDKRGSIWKTAFDGAKRPWKETAPAVDIVKVNQNSADDSLSFEELPNQCIETISDFDAASNLVSSMVAANIPGQVRIIHKQHDKNNRSSGVMIPEVKIDNGNSELPVKGVRPEVTKDIETRIIRDFAAREIVQINPDGSKQFTIYDCHGRIRFEIDGNGQVTERAYDYAFAEHTRLIRHEVKIEQSVLDEHAAGFNLKELKLKYPQIEENDRTLYFKHNKRGLTIAVSKDEILTAEATNQQGYTKGVMIAPETRYKFNAFGETIRQEDLVNSQRKKAVTLHYYDNNGSEELTVSPRGFVTQATFGIKNRSEANQGYLNLTKTHWHNKLKFPWKNRRRITQEKIITHLTPNPLFDRFYRYQYDRRLLPISETVASGTKFWEAILDANGVPIRSEKYKTSVTSQTEYDDAGEVNAYINDVGLKRFLNRNAAGALVSETDFPKRLSAHAQEEVIPFTRHLFNAHQAVGSIKYANSASLDANTQRVLEPALNPEKDQQTLFLTDKCGNATVTQTPQGALIHATFNEFKKMVRHYRWSSGYKMVDGHPQKIATHLQVRRHEFNKKQKIIMTSLADEDREIQTHKAINAFDEFIGEGPHKNEMLLRNAHDKAGNIIFSNKENGIPTVSFPNACGDQVVSFRSANLDLSFYEHKQLAAQKALLDSDQHLTYKAIQRTTLKYDAEHNLKQQFFPWDRRMPADVPKVMQMSFTNILIDSAPHIVWPFYDIKLLTGVFKIRLKGTSKWQILPVKEVTDPQYPERPLRGVDISKLETNHYEYHLDLYYQEKDQRARSPSYCALGEVLLDTGNYAHADKLMWYMQDESTLILAGLTENVFGIELLQDGKPIKRLGGSKNANGQMVFDLSQEISGNYAFKVVTGAEILQDQISFGTAPNTALGYYQPFYKFDGAGQINQVGLPQEIISLGTSNIFTASLPVPFADYEYGNEHQDYHRLVHKGLPMPGSATYGTDASGQRFFLGNYVPIFQKLANESYYTGDNRCLTGCHGNAFYLLRYEGPKQPHAVMLYDQGLSFGPYLLKPWANGTYQFSANAVPPTATLHAAVFNLDHQPATKSLGDIQIQTAHPSPTLQAREINLTNLQIKNYKIAGSYFCEDARDTPRNYYHYAWQTNLGTRHRLIAAINGIRTEISDLSQLPDLVVNGLSHPGRFQQMMPSYPVSAGAITLDLIDEREALIPLGEFTPQIDTVNSTPFVLVPFDSTVSYNAQYIDKSSYDNIHVLYFSPLPQGVNTIQFEYAELTSLDEKVWRKLEVNLSAQGFVVPLKRLAPGSYHYRTQMRDIAGKSIDLHVLGLSAAKEGWFEGQMQVNKGLAGNKVFVSKHQDQVQQIVKPTAKAKSDRYTNKISEVNRSGKETKFEFNLFNLKTKTLSPPVTSTDEHNQPYSEQPESLVTEDLFNTLAQQTGTVAPNGGEKIRLPNAADETLRTRDADGIYHSNTHDIFGRTIISQGMKGAPVTTEFACKDKMLIETRKNADATTDVFERNELNRVISHEDNRHNMHYADHDAEGHEILTIDPLLKTEEHEFDKRTGLLTKFKDKEGRRQYTNRGPDEDDQHGLTVPQPSATDAYCGNAVLHIDFAGQLVEMFLNYNKQVTAKRGMVNEEINAKRGRAEFNSDKAPPAIDIRYQLSDAGHILDIIDDGAQLTTHKRYDLDDYCINYFFVDQNGHVQQANCTTYDDAHRIVKVCDTRIMIELGYDKNSNRRYARAYVRGDNGESLGRVRDSWYTYTTANRPILRDAILNGIETALTENQGMELGYDKGVVNLIRQIKFGGEVIRQDITADPLTNLPQHISVKSEASGKEIAAKKFRRAVDYYSVVENKGCMIYLVRNKPTVAESLHFNIPTYVLVLNEKERTLYDYRDVTRPVIIPEDADQQLYDHLKRFDGYIVGENLPDEMSRFIQAAIREYDERMHGRESRQVTNFATDGSIASQVQFEKNKTLTHTYGAADQMQRQEQNLIEGVIPSEGEEDPETYSIKDDTTFKNALSDKVEISQAETTRTQSRNVAHGPPKASIYNKLNANGAITGVTGSLPVNENNRPESFREFIVNSEDLTVVKHSAFGAIYYIYAEQMPGEMVLMAYFGTIPEPLLARAHARAKLQEDNQPPVMVMDQKFLGEYPSNTEADYLVTERMTYLQIAERLNFTGCAALIATANGADETTVVEANTHITIPSLSFSIPNTAWNGSLPTVDKIIGSLYPTLPIPPLNPKHKQINWVEEFLEVAAAVAIMAAMPGMLVGVVGALGSVIGEAGAVAVEYAGLAALAGTVDQAIAIGFGSRKSFDVKSIAAQALASAVSAGVLGATGIGFQTMKSFDIGVIAKNVVTAELINAAQQSVALATGLERHMDWKSFGTAAFNGATATVSDATFGQATWQSAGATTFAESLGADAIYHQSPNWSDITAKTAGAMVGTSLGSKVKQMSMASHQQAVHTERSAPTNVHAVASVGQPAASQGVGRKAPKPAYATKAKVTTLQASKDHGDVETAPAARMQAAANNVDAAQASRVERFMQGAAKEQGIVGQHARLFADQKSFTFSESVASLGKGFTDDLWESLPDTQALGQSIGSGVYNAVHNPTQTLSDLGSSVKSKLAYLKVLHDNPLGVLLYLKAVEKQKIETFKQDMSDAVTKVKAGDLSPIGRMGAEVFKLVALGGVAKVAPALKGVGLFARGANVERTVVATGGESVGKSKNILQDVLKTAKPTPGKLNQLEAVLDDGTKVIFRRDIGEHAHPIGKDYPAPVDHYNIEIHASNPARPGKFIPQENVHIVVDENLQPVDVFLKDKTRLGIDFSKRLNN